MALHKNYSIVAVTVIAAVALVGTLGAVPISEKAAPDVGKKYHLHKDVKRENENVQVNVEDNVTVYNVKDEQFEVAMNSSRNIVENTSGEEDGNDDDELMTFFVNASPIKNKTFLNPSVQEFCRDLDAYWLIQMDNNTLDGANTHYPADGDHDREKRSPCSNNVNI
ncbi:leukocyte cell-derived chemotaxin 1-like, partial [Lingula anatina]|uniref:Leukocyte cell-derived chemotaxin 1-like n=1 Tax=Lingula anatina TaxID=7574 RepID=A0A1S3IUP4_LINAN